ncbi:MAG: exodeoxyribonuclease VII large subunit [Pikeienuella sp.]
MDLIDDDSTQGGNAPEFSVSELSGAVKRVVEGAFDHVRVRGEVGRVSRPRSGHLYMDLKDDRAVLAAICWKGVAARLEVQPEEGMEVVASGRLTTFPGQSRYQLVIDNIAPAGMGALMAMLEKRKAALGAEGLFAPDRKQPLPFMPRSVGVITSPSGAVIRDILHRLAERFPLPVHVWPVAVQGKGCAEQVAAAIRGFNALSTDGLIRRPDVLIVARGGGSVEDLWGFNEEAVVRAVADSRIPLISAVGHETDTTLIDFASDRRAPTPTAAAEMAVPVRAELLARLAELEERRTSAMARLRRDRAQRLADLTRALPRPSELLAERRQRLDYTGERLPRALRQVASDRRARLATIAGRLTPSALTAKLAEPRERLRGLATRAAPALARRRDRLQDHLNHVGSRMNAIPRRLERITRDQRKSLVAMDTRMGRAGPAKLEAFAERLAASTRLLESLGYKGVLARGYTVVRDQTGALVTGAKAAKTGAAVSIEFADGDVQAVIGGKAVAQTSLAPKPPIKPKPNKTKDGGQGSFDL